MYFIYLVLTCGLVIVNLAGLSAACSSVLPAPASRRVLALVSITLVFFNLEHIQGLGRLDWLWPITTSVSAWLLWQRKNRLKIHEFWRGEWIFLAGFCYGLIWRFCFPDINALSEHLTDLYFISNYYSGDTLPPNDRWLAGNLFNFYYAFQHYAAALFGRIFNLNIGLSMNLSWAIMMALMISLVWEILSYTLKQRWLKCLILLCFLVGGNGISPLIPWLIKAQGNTIQKTEDVAVQRLWASTRFSGYYDKYINTSFGQMLFGNPAEQDFNQHQELPFETLAYLTYLGDFHPPLGGFLLLLWMLALLMGIEKDSIIQSHPATGPPQIKPSREQVTFFAIGLTPALVLVTNSWVFPMQCLVLLSWLLYRYRSGSLLWGWLFAGAVFGFAGIYPFLGYFANSALDTPIRLVTEGNHTPPEVFIAMHWPSLLWIILGLSQWRKHAWCAWFAFTIGIILVFSELFFVDDPIGGKYDRFNTTLKWWSWLWPATLVGLLPLVLANCGRYGRLLIIASLLPLFIYGLDLARYLLYAPKAQIGNMAGDGWLRENEADRTMLSYLSNAPDGVVLESASKGAYSISGAFTLFAQKTAVIGWPNHVSQWHGRPDFIKQRTEQVRSFFRSEMTDPLEFLAQFPVQYIIWRDDDEKNQPRVRIDIDRQINQKYQWHSFSRNGVKETGIWVRVNE